ncbi:FecR family protein [Thalassospira profundimaris]|uniref:FecR family protein n=1 Tax=Thalassospira profundimaris TaxID=502049 RepID=UPI000DED6ED2|nr:FecR family protein [Thalassospira profundimaris]
MNERDADFTAEISYELFQEAVIWHGRLREAAFHAGSQETVMAEFESWQQQSSLHPAAFREVELLWGKLELPVKRIWRAQGQVSPVMPDAQEAQSQAGRQKPSNGWRIAALAAVILLCIVTGGYFKNDVEQYFNPGLYITSQQPMTQTLPDGSQITMNVHSRLEVAFGADKRLVKLQAGEVWFDVAHNAQKPFVVETAQGTITVLGTRFNVRKMADSVIVSLVQGKVALRDKATASQAPTLLAPGMAADLTPTGVGKAHSFDAFATTAWQKDQMVFYDAPVSEVVRELNRYYPGKIVIANRHLADLHISGVFRTDNIGRVLDAIENTLSVRVIRVTDYLVFLAGQDDA